MAKNWIIESAVETDEIIINDAGSPVNFRIEGDSDSNLFVVNAKTDKVGIGTASPEGQFDVISASTDEEFHVINAYRYGNIPWAGHITVRKARGTFVNPAIAQSGDNVAAFFGEVYDGVKYIHSGGMVVLADSGYGAFGTSDIASRVNINVNPGSSTSTVPVVAVASDKTVAIGNLGSYGGAFKKPGATLEVLGTLKLLKGDGTATTSSADNSAAVDEILTSTTGIGATNLWADDQIATAKVIHDLFASTNNTTDTTVNNLVVNKIAGRITDATGNGAMSTFNMWSVDGTSVHVGTGIPQSSSHQYTFGVKGTVGINDSLYVGGNTTATEFGDSNTHKDVNVTFKSDAADKDFKWDGGDNSLTLGTSGGATKGVDFRVYGDANGSTAANQRSIFWDASANNLMVSATNMQMQFTSNSHITPIGAGSGLEHGNDVPLIVQAHASNTTAPIADFRDKDGATKVEIKADGSIESQGGLSVKAGKIINFQQDIVANPSATDGCFIYNISSAKMYIGGDDWLFVDTGAGSVAFLIEPDSSTGKVTLEGGSFREMIFGSHVANTALRIPTSSAIHPDRMGTEEGGTAYRGIYTSNLKIDNSDGVIEAIGTSSAEDITVKAKGASGTVYIGGVDGQAVKIGATDPSSTPQMTTCLDDLTVAGNLTVTGSYTGTITGIDKDGTDEELFYLNADDTNTRVGIRAVGGDTLKVLKANGSTTGFLQAKQITNNAALELSTSGGAFDINLLPNSTGKVNVGSGANNKNLEVWGNLTVTGDMTLDGLTLTGDLITTGQATTHQIIAGNTSAWIVREGSSGTAYMQIDSTNDDLHLCPSNSTANAEVTFFANNVNTNHQVYMFGRTATEYLSMITDDDLHGRSGQSAVNVVGVPLHVGYDASNNNDVRFYSSTGGQFHWDSTLSTLRIGQSTSNDDNCNVEIWGYATGEFLKWNASASGANLDIAAEIIQSTDDDVSLGGGKALVYDSDANTVSINPDAGGMLSISTPFYGSTNTMTSSSDAQTMAGGNTLYVNTTSGDIILGGLVPILSTKSITMHIHKSYASNTLTIEHNESSASSNNRFLFPNLQDFVIESGVIGVFEFRYDTIWNKWVPVETAIRNALIEDAVAVNVLKVEESGTTRLLNSGTEFATTLPAPAAGLEYTFIVKAAPSGASYTVVVNGGTFIGGVTCQTSNDLGAYDNNGTTITFVDGQAIVGDRVHMISDGTNWYVDGHSFVAEGITIG